MTSVPDGMFLDQYGNAKQKVGDLSGAELRYFEQYRRQQVARNNQRDAQARAATAPLPAEMNLFAAAAREAAAAQATAPLPAGNHPFAAAAREAAAAQATAPLPAGNHPFAVAAREAMIANRTPAEEIVALNPSLTPVGIEETIVPPTIPNQPSLELPQMVAAPTPPTIPNQPSLELPQMVPPAQEGIASLAPQPMVPAFQPFIPAPAPTNTGYNFQELLNMYKNPYA